MTSEICAPKARPVKMTYFFGRAGGVFLHLDCESIDSLETAKLVIFFARRRRAGKNPHFSVKIIDFPFTTTMLVQILARRRRAQKILGFYAIMCEANIITKSLRFLMKGGGKLARYSTDSST